MQIQATIGTEILRHTKCIVREILPDRRGDHMEPRSVVLKKYANRRLYDTEKSIYVTLHEVSAYIRDGADVLIIDAKTKEDVTAFTLTQIILEEAKNNNTLLPVPLLHLIIRYGDNLMGEFFEKYLQQIFRNFVTHKQAMDDQFQRWIEAGLNMSQATQKSFSEFNPFQPFFDPFGGDHKKKKDK
jgi:polyhydroxyalkanoate synthesis repressor PhaR